MNNKALMGAITIIALSLSNKPLIRTQAQNNKEVLNQITTTNTRDFVSVKNAPATPNLNKPHGYASASALLWNITTDMDAISFTSGKNLVTDDASTKTTNNEWGWNWGIKASLGFRCCDDDWDLSFDFAYLQSSQRYRNKYFSGEKVGDVSYGVVPLQAGILKEVYAFNSRANLYYYDGDMQLSREYFVSKRLSIKPLAGVKGVYFVNKYHLNFSQFDDNLDIFTYFRNTQKNDYWGVGPQLGSSFRFGLTKHFSFECQLDGAMLWGKILNNFSSEDLSNNTVSKLSNPTYQVVPNFNIFAGFVYDTNFDSDTKNFAFTLGYENRYFWNNMTSFTLNSFKQKGSTSLQGFNAGLTFSY